MAQPDEEIFETPIDGYGPDDIHVELKSDDGSIIKALPPPKPMHFSDAGFESSIGTSGRFIAYYSPARMLHPGTFRVEAAIELQLWDWVTEEQNALEENWVNRPIEVISPRRFRVEAAESSPQHRPACYSRVVEGSSLRHDGSVGTWVSTSRSNKTAGGRSAHRGLGDRTVIKYTGLEHRFEQDLCSLASFSSLDALTCLSNRVIHVYGDRCVPAWRAVNASSYLKAACGGERSRRSVRRENIATTRWQRVHARTAGMRTSRRATCQCALARESRLILC